MSDSQGSAVVTITIRVTSRGHWGGGATIEEVMKQGGREALNQITKALQAAKVQYDIVGQPKFGVVTWDRGDTGD